MDDALRYFEEEKGKHFDPKIVDVMLTQLDDIKAIRQRLPD